MTGVRGVGGGGVRDSASHPMRRCTLSHSLLPPLWRLAGVEVTSIRASIHGWSQGWIGLIECQLRISKSCPRGEIRP